MPRPSARTIALVLAAVCGVYLLAIARISWQLVTSGEAVAVVMGVAIAAIPVIGAWVVWREVQFGVRTAELGHALAASGELPADDLPRRPSGRAERDAADARFVERKREVEAAPDDIGAWFRLSVAYDDAGDRRRARAAMRTAIEKHQRQRSGS